MREEEPIGKRRRGLGRLALPERLIASVDDELAFHVEGRVEELVAAGWSEEDARAEALRQFGDLDRYRRECRAIAQDRIVRERRGEIVHDVMQDVRFAVRGLRRSPGFAGVAVLTLALGIGATTAVFNVAKNVVLDPLPFRDPEALVMVWEQNLAQEITRDLPSPPNYTDWRRQNRTFTDLAAMSDGSMTLTGADQPRVVQVAYVSPNLFEVLGAPAQRGRTFTEADAAEGDQAPLALIGDGLWRSVFGSDPGVPGRTLQLNGRPLAVVGVMPPTFEVPRPDIDVWIPADYGSADIHRQSRYLRVVGRLAPGQNPASAKTDLDAIQARIAVSFPEANEGWTVDVTRVQDEVVGASTRTVLALLLGAVGFVLLIACANVANLLLGRSTTRDREIGVRTALGASRPRIVGQLLTESVVLGLAGGVLGLALAHGSVRVLVALDPMGLPRTAEIGLDGASLAFAAAASVLTAALFGLAPAMHASRRSVSEALKGAATVGARSPERARSALVVAEVAVSLVLLVGAGLLARSLMALRAVDPGFDPRGVLVARVSLGGGDYPTSEGRIVYFDEMLRRLREIPGVTGAAVTMSLPMDPAGIAFDLPYLAEGQPALPEEQLPQTDYRVASDGYFEAMGMELMRGRTFTRLDRRESARVTVVTESLARQLWPGQDAVGKTLTVFYITDSPWEVVGVVGDTRHTGLGAPAAPQFFIPLAQAEWVMNYMHFAVKTHPEASAAVAAEMRRVGIEVDPKYPLYSLGTMEGLMAATTARDRFVASLLGAFSLLALALAAVGIHGVMAYQVALRTREIGLRIALGAERGQVLGSVLRRAAALASVGVVLGLAGAAVATRAVRGFLFEVSPFDPLTFAGVAGALVGVACVAALVPAVRAARMDPAGALRAD